MGCAPSRCKVGCCKVGCCEPSPRDKHVQTSSTVLPHKQPIKERTESFDSSEIDQPITDNFIDYRSIDIAQTYRPIFPAAGFDAELDIEQAVLDIVDKQLSSLNMSTRKLIRKEILDLPSEDQYIQYIDRGENSAIVTDVDRHRLGCIKACETIDTNIEVQMLRQLNIDIEQFIFNQLQIITKKEDKTISKHAQDRKTIIDEMLLRGNAYLEDYENEYKKLLEAYIRKLQSLMIQHLEKLYKGIKMDQRDIFITSQNYMEDLTVKAQVARKNLIEKIYTVANRRIHQFFLDTKKISDKITNQPLGREEFRTINLRVYSTVGENGPEFGCDNIPDRNKYLKAIDEKKPQHAPKRTVYLENTLTRTIPK